MLVAQWHKLLTASERSRALEEVSALTITVDEVDATIAFGRTSALADRYGVSMFDAACLEVALRRALPLGSRDSALRTAAARNVGTVLT